MGRTVVGSHSGRWRERRGCRGQGASQAGVVTLPIGRIIFEHKLGSSLGPFELEPLDADGSGCRAGSLAKHTPHGQDLVGLLVAPEGGSGDEDSDGHDGGHDASQHPHGLHGVVFGLHQEGGHGILGQHLQERVTTAVNVPAWSLQDRVPGVSSLKPDSF